MINNIKRTLLVLGVLICSFSKVGACEMGVQQFFSYALMNEDLNDIGEQITEPKEQVMIKVRKRARLEDTILSFNHLLIGHEEYLTPKQVKLINSYIKSREKQLKELEGYGW